MLFLFCFGGFCLCGGSFRGGSGTCSGFCLPIFLFLSADVDHEVGENAEDERARDGRDGDRAELERHAAHARDEHDGCGEQVAVFVEVDFLQHFQTADGDKAVQSDTHAAHDAGRNGIEEGGEHADKGAENGKDCRDEGGCDGSVAGNGDAADGFAVRRVGAAAEEGARDGTYAVAEERSGKTGIDEQVTFDDGRDVFVIGEVLGKPKDRADAIAMLRKLSGRTHEVITGVCLTTRERSVSFPAVSSVRFATLDDAEITYYVDHYRPFDKAGSYGIQEWIGYVAVEAIEGSFYNVMGLPIRKVYEALKRWEM